MECPECNSEIPDGSHFCNECGSEIKDRTEQSYEHDPEMKSCPKCGRMIFSSAEECPNCGQAFAPDDSELQEDWVKDYEFLLWGLKIRHGSYDRFYEGSYSFLGNTQTNSYSKGRYIVQFGGSILILAVISLALLYFAIMAPAYPEVMLMALLALGFTAFAGWFYYWLGFVPPRSYRRKKRTSPKGL